MNKHPHNSTQYHSPKNDFATSFTTEMWQLEVNLGDEYFSAERFLTALGHYHQAIAIAETLLTIKCDQEQSCQPSTEQSVVAMVMVSYHNLADLYLVKHEYQLAERAYQQANEQLIVALETIDEGSAMHLALLSGINRNRSILKLHQQEYGKSAKPTPEKSNNRFSHIIPCTCHNTSKTDYPRQK